MVSPDFVIQTVLTHVFVQDCRSVREEGRNWCTVLTIAVLLLKPVRALVVALNDNHLRVELQVVL